MTIPLLDRLVKGAPAGEIDADLLRADADDFGVDADKNLTIDTPAVATSTAQGDMSAADKAKLDGVEQGATADQTGNEIATALTSAGFALSTSTGGRSLPVSIFSNASGTTLVQNSSNSTTVTQDPDDFEVLMFDIKPSSSIRQLAYAYRDGSAWATTSTARRGFNFNDRLGNDAVFNLFSTGPTNLSFTSTSSSGGWGGSTENVVLYEVWGYATMDDFISYAATGTVAGEAPATWARADNTDQVPGSKLQNTGMRVIPSTDVTAAPTNGLPGDNVYWNEDDSYLYRLREGPSVRTDLPVAMTFDVTAPGTHNGFLYRGYLSDDVDEDFTFGDANGSLTVAPGSTLTAGFNGLLSVDVVGDQLGDAILVLTRPEGSTFVPARVLYQVPGGAGGTIEGWSRTQAFGATDVWLASGVTTAGLYNLFGIADGMTGDLTVNVDVRDADGNSYFPTATSNRVLDRISIGQHEAATPVPVSAIEGYGNHHPPDRNSQLIDLDTGDTFYSRTETTDDVLIEPVHVSGNEYGHTGPRPASTNLPTGVSVFTWDTGTGNVRLLADNATNRDALHSVRYYDQDDASGTGLPITARTVPLPAVGHPAETLSRHASLRVFGSDHEAATGVASTLAGETGDVTVTTPSVTLRWDASARRLTTSVPFPFNRDMHSGDPFAQKINLVNEGLVNNRILAYETGDDGDAMTDGTLPPASDQTGSTAFYPCLYKVRLHLDASGAGDRVVVPYHVTASGNGRRGNLWLVIENALTGDPDFRQVALDDTNVFGPLEYVQDLTDTPYHLYAHDYSFPQTTRNAGIRNKLDVPGPYYLTILWSPGDDPTAWEECYTPGYYDTVEIEGVGVPLELHSTRLVQPSTARATGAREAYLTADYRTAAYSTDQPAPLLAGSEYRVNLVNARGVSAGPYDVRLVRPDRWRAHRFAALHASGVKATSSVKQWWWDVQNRTDKTPNSALYADGRPFERRRYYHTDWTATPRVVEGVVCYVRASTRVVGGVPVRYEAINITQDRDVNLGSAPVSSLRITDLLIFDPLTWGVALTNPDDGRNDVRSRSPVVRLYLATGETLKPISFRIDNLSTGWAWTFTSINVHEHALQGTVELDFRDGDQLQLILSRAGMAPSGRQHRVNVWTAPVPIGRHAR